MARETVRKLYREIADEYRRILRGLWRFTPAPPPATGATRRRLSGGLVVRRGEEVAAAYTMQGGVSVEGRVAGEVGVVFGRAEAEGAVGGDVRVLLGDARVGGTVGGSVEVGFGDVVLEEDARVGGDVIVGVGTVNGGRFGRRGEYHPRLPTGARVAGEVRTGTITKPWALQESIVLAGIVALLAAVGVVALYVKTTRHRSRR